MKFIAIIDESQLNIDEKMYLIFESKNKRNLSIKPIHKEMLVNKDGESVYLSDGHIKCFLDYEQKKILEEVIYRNPIVGRVEKEDTAEWIRQFPGSKLLKCSKCGYEYCDLLECTNYCGNCGARMKESEEEE